MKRLFRFLVLVAAVVLLLIPAIPVGAIQNGTDDEEGHPYVCVVCFYDDYFEFMWRTSGELIAPDIVLTAGHGTLGDNGEDVPHACVWFDSNLDPTSSETLPYPTTLYADYGNLGTGHTGTPFTYPEYNGVYYDVGVVILDSDVLGITPATLPEAGVVDTLPMMQPVDIVGYGVQWQKRGALEVGFPPGFAPPPPYTAWTWNHKRQYATANLVQSQNILGSQFLSVSANPAKGKGGTTFGDSGGPILLVDTNIILGINSFVYNYNCAGVTYAQRIDIQEILDWLADPYPGE